MIDGTLGVGVAEGDGVAVSEPPVSSTGAEPKAPPTEQAGTASDAVPDGGSEEGQAGRQRGKSVYSKVRELEARLRDQRGYWESEVGGLKQQLEEIRTQFGQQGRKPTKTFWEAPEEVLEERLSSHLTEFEKRMASKFEQTQEQREQAVLQKQEMSEAAKFIRSQKGLTEDDIQDIAEILRSNPNLEKLPYMDQAEFALFKWQKERGITDNTAKKQRASSVTGAPATGGGPKMWTEAEINAELAKFPPNPANYTPEDEARFKKLDDEWKRAFRENRVTK